MLSLIGPSDPSVLATRIVGLVLSLIQMFKNIFRASAMACGDFQEDYSETASRDAGVLSKGGL